MKTTINMMLVLTMFVTPMFAGDDGNQGSGGYSCDPQIEQCAIAPPAPVEGGDVSITTIFVEVARKGLDLFRL